jgi:hypothetical protein
MRSPHEHLFTNRRSYNDALSMLSDEPLQFPRRTRPTAPIHPPAPACATRLDTSDRELPSRDLSRSDRSARRYLIFARLAARNRELAIRDERVRRRWRALATSSGEGTSTSEKIAPGRNAPTLPPRHLMFTTRPLSLAPRSREARLQESRNKRSMDDAPPAQDEASEALRV